MGLSEAMEKTPATPGIDPATFRLVAQYHMKILLDDFNLSFLVLMNTGN
jgi:hypothetical protein